MLTNEQIDQLFLFCEKHSVRFYDVQVELVDHLANAIEEKMAADKNLGFETALTRVHQGFGPLGFAGFVNSRSGMIYSRYNQIKKREFRSFFTIPKIAFTICMIVILTLMPQFLKGEYLSYFAALFIITTGFYELYITHKHRRWVNKQSKKLMMTQFGPEQSWFSSFITMQFLSTKFVLHETAATPFWVYETIMVSTFLLLLLHVAYNKASVHLFADARRMYPEAFAVSR